MKTENRICPVCGEVYTVKNVDKITLHSLLVKMQCPNSHIWTEKYTLSYQGYEYNNKKYNQFGGNI